MVLDNIENTNGKNKGRISKGLVTGLAILAAAAQIGYSRPGVWFDANGSTASIQRDTIRTEGVLFDFNGGAEVPLGGLSLIVNGEYKMAVGTKSDGPVLEGKFEETALNFDLGGKFTFSYKPVDISFGLFGEFGRKTISETYGGYVEGPEVDDSIGYGILFGVSGRTCNAFNSGEFRYATSKGFNPVSQDMENVSKMQLVLERTTRSFDGSFSIKGEGVNIEGEPSTSYNGELDGEFMFRGRKGIINYYGASAHIAPAQAKVWLQAGHSDVAGYSIVAGVTPDLSGVKISFELPLEAPKGGKRK